MLNALAIDRFFELTSFFYFSLEHTLDLYG